MAQQNEFLWCWPSLLPLERTKRLGYVILIRHLGIDVPSARGKMFWCCGVHSWKNLYFIQHILCFCKLKSNRYELGNAKLYYNSTDSITNSITYHSVIKWYIFWHSWILATSDQKIGKSISFKLITDVTIDLLLLDRIQVICTVILK